MICSVGMRGVNLYLILVAVDTHLAVANDKGVDFGDVAHRSGRQYTIESSCKSVCVLLENLPAKSGRELFGTEKCVRTGTLASTL